MAAHDRGKQVGNRGVAWLDTRDDPKQLSFNVYFSASVDGGRRFSPARRISTQPSIPYGAGNAFINYHSQTIEKTGVRTLRGDGGFRRFFMDGDYLGMAATADGKFHPLWPDARDGTHQLYTAAIAVGSARQSTAPKVVSTDVTSDVQLKVDLTKWDSVSRTATLPVRLRNISSRRIYPPLRVELVSGDNAAIVDAGSPSGSGGLDYSGALGDLAYLAPGQVSEALPWRVKIDNPRLVPRLRLKIKGSVETGGR